VNDHEDRSRSSELALFDWPYSLSLPIRNLHAVTMPLSFIYRFRYITTFTQYVMPVALISSSVSITQLKLKVTFASRVMCKHIVVNTCYIIFQRMSDINSDLQCHSRSLVSAPFERPQAISYYSSIMTISLHCTVFEILSVISKKLKRSNDPEPIPFGSNLSRMRYYASCAHRIWSSQFHPFQIYAWR